MRWPVWAGEESLSSQEAAVLGSYREIQDRFRNGDLYFLAFLQDNWGIYSPKLFWRVRPAVRVTSLWSDTNSQGGRYTRIPNRTAHTPSSLTKNLALA